MNQGIKESKEALAGALALGVLFYKKFADGVTTQDFMEIFAKFQLDEAFKAKVVEAYNGANLIEGELKDLTLAEGIELSVFALQETSKAIGELKA
jgi:hypothetical protein